jgi:hypothetical protein
MPGSEDGLTGGDGMDRAHDLLLLGALEHVSARAGAHGREYRVVIVEHGEHQHRDVRGHARDLARGCDPAQLRHLDIHHQHIGPQRHGGVHRLPAGGGHFRATTTDGTDASSADRPSRTTG